MREWLRAWWQKETASATVEIYIYLYLSISIYISISIYLYIYTWWQKETASATVAISCQSGWSTPIRSRMDENLLRSSARSMSVGLVPSTFKPARSSGSARLLGAYTRKGTRWSFR